jgi:Mn2+/Fe2+ NRAMP family transporter
MLEHAAGCMSTLSVLSLLEMPVLLNMCFNYLFVPLCQCAAWRLGIPTGKRAAAPDGAYTYTWCIFLI